jgi:hypothetical protein
MDWKRRIRESLQESGVVLDEDVVEELAAHLAAAYQTMRAEGSDEAEAESHATRLIDSWRRQAPYLRHRSNRSALVEVPSEMSSRFAGLFNDLRYALRMLNRQRAFAALSISTIAIGIGILTSLFSVAYVVFWKPLP